MSPQRVHECMSTSVTPPVHAAATHLHHSIIPHWLTNLGGLGLFAVAVLDSSVIPLPLPGSTDLLLLWLVSHRGNAWLLVVSAIDGSILGGYTNWSAGKKGGEAALQKHIRPQLLKRISGWIETHSVLSVFLPALLPPPIPLTPFILASGALGISRNRFLIAYSAARTLRYGLVAWLGVTYGRHVVRVWSEALKHWSPALLWAFGGLLLIAFCVGTWRIVSQRKLAGGSQKRFATV